MARRRARRCRDPVMRPGSRRASAGAGGHAAGAGRGSRAGAGAHSARADAGVAVRFLPRSGRADGRRPRRDAAVGPDGPAVRRRAPVELRWLRFARPRAGLRYQRLRRDRARSMGVGCQAARGEHRDRRPRARPERPRCGAVRWRRPCARTARRCGASPRCATWSSGMRGSTWPASSATSATG